MLAKPFVRKYSVLSLLPEIPEPIRRHGRVDAMYLIRTRKAQRKADRTSPARCALSCMADAGPRWPRRISTRPSALGPTTVSTLPGPVLRASVPSQTAKQDPSPHEGITKRTEIRVRDSFGGPHAEATTLAPLDIPWAERWPSTRLLRAYCNPTSARYLFHSPRKSLNRFGARAPHGPPRRCAVGVFIRIAASLAKFTAAPVHTQMLGGLLFRVLNDNKSGVAGGYKGCAISNL